MARSGRFLAGLLLAFLALVAACAHGPEEVVTYPRFEPAPERGANFSARVRNESPALDAVDVTVYLDGELAFRGVFGKSGSDGATPPILLYVPPGAHVLRAVSNVGGARAEKRFTMPAGGLSCSIAYEFSERVPSALRVVFRETPIRTE